MIIFHLRLALHINYLALHIPFIVGKFSSYTHRFKQIKVKMHINYIIRILDIEIAVNFFDYCVYLVQLHIFMNKAFSGQTTGKIFEY